MSKSLLSNDPWCLVCGDPRVERHHIYYGTANRRKSEKYGCWCYLCIRHHRDHKVGVHFNQRLNQELRETCQRRFEDEIGDREEFRKIFGRSYL